MSKRLLLDPPIYHVFNKSIGRYQIFSSEKENERFMKTLRYYNQTTILQSLSTILRCNMGDRISPILSFSMHHKVKILAYCLMPDHYHLLVKSDSRASLYTYVNLFENSYTRYLNIRRKRKGPLWQNPYKSPQIVNDYQFRHVMRYIHLNPVTDYLVEQPEQWKWSSYRAYINDPSLLKEYAIELTTTTPERLKRFTVDQKSYQRSLKRIRKHLI